MHLWRISAANRKASSANRKASSKDWKVFSEEVEGFFRKALDSYTHKIQKCGAASLMYLLCLRLGLPRLCSLDEDTNRKKAPWKYATNKTILEADIRQNEPDRLNEIHCFCTLNKAWVGSYDITGLSRGPNISETPVVQWLGPGGNLLLV